MRAVLRSSAACCVLLLLALPATGAEQTNAHDSALTVNLTSPIAMQAMLPGLSEPERRSFAIGRGLFNQLWIAAPSLDPEVDGLGPTFNQSSCAACHLRNGRGQPPASPNERMRGMLIRLSVPAEEGASVPHADYGEQLQDSAISGVQAEGRASINWEEHVESFADGEQIMLRRPVISFTSMAFGDLPEDVQLSPRVAPQLVGAGLIDAVAEATLEQLAARPVPDGISGRVNRMSGFSQGRGAVGRFGWKANAASLELQTAAAFSGDLGLTSRHFPHENCPAAQQQCAAAIATSPDVTDSQLADVVFYQAALAIPAQRDRDDAQVREGRALFDAAGCQHCHLPELQSGKSTLLPALSNQHFAAYTDLLLHDMGAALSDGRPDQQAEGSEWRTAPLWGIGLLPFINEHDTLLHDGRARGVLEAIMWHGGEAEAARERVRNMSRQQREALIRFVNSL